MFKVGIQTYHLEKDKHDGRRDRRALIWNYGEASLYTQIVLKGQLETD